MAMFTLIWQQGNMVSSFCDSSIYTFYFLGQQHKSASHCLCTKCVNFSKAIAAVQWIAFNTSYTKAIAAKKKKFLWESMCIKDCLSFLVSEGKNCVAFLEMLIRGLRNFIIIKSCFPSTKKKHYASFCVCTEEIGTVRWHFHMQQ